MPTNRVGPAMRWVSYWLLLLFTETMTLTAEVLPFLALADLFLALADFSLFQAELRDCWRDRTDIAERAGGRTSDREKGLFR